MSRQSDLESLVRDAYRIVQEYENKSIFSDRPDEQARIDYEIKKRSEIVKETLTRYKDFVEANPTIIVPQDISDLARSFQIPLPKGDTEFLIKNITIQSNSAPAPTSNSYNSELASCIGVFWLILSVILGWVIYDKFEASWWSAFFCWGPGIALIIAAALIGLAEKGNG